MRTFQVLPTDERFQNLTEEQLIWIVEHLKLDAEELDNAQKGVDESFYDETYEEWERQAVEEDAGSYFK